MRFKSDSDKSTKEFAKKLINKKLKDQEKPIILALRGDLGAGKTTFIKGLADALSVKTHVTSPTFLIVQKYPLNIEGFKNLFHIDAYRLEKSQEILNLEFKDIINKEGNIVVIEWADKIKDAIPDNATWLKFKHGENKNERIIEVKNGKKES